MPGLTLVPVPAPTSAPATERGAERGHRERDPHTLPTFTDASIHEPTSPVLYLPPLLSALPRRISHTNSNAKEAATGNHDFYNQYYDRAPAHPTGLDIPKLPPHPDRLHPTATRLPDIDPASLALHRALHFLKPHDGFERLPYAEAFNWDEIGAAYRSDGSPTGEIEREWYIVAFRSRRRAGSDSAREFRFMLYCIRGIFLPTSRSQLYTRRIGWLTKKRYKTEG